MRSADGRALLPPLDDDSARHAAGTVIDQRYKLIERIGIGGMGSVYRAEHTGLGTSFAIKIPRAELARDPRMIERFVRESRAAASVVSEHVVPIVDNGTLPDGTPYFVMQLLIGSDLGALLATLGRLTPVRAVNLAIDACRGLAAAHARGLVHRDLKPANLFVTRGDDGRDVLKLLDFGVVKIGDGDTTRPGALLGSARYMAPEQIGLDTPVGPRTDLFSLGVILYQCLAGEVPFDGDTTERIIYKIMTEQPTPLAERCPDLPPKLATAVHKALAKQPDERYASAEAFEHALLEFAGARRLHVETAIPQDEATNPGLDAEATPSTPKNDAALRPSRRRQLVRTAALAIAGWLVFARIFETLAENGTAGGRIGAKAAPSITTPERREAGPRAGPPETGPPETGPPEAATIRARSIPPNSASPPIPTSAPELVPSKPRPTEPGRAAGARADKRVPMTLPAAAFDPENPYGP